MQLYRENAKYLDRAYKWIAKVGLDWAKERVVDDIAGRQALVDRFDLSQRVFQRDPWTERSGGEQARAFGPIADFRIPEAAE